MPCMAGRCQPSAVSRSVGLTAEIPAGGDAAVVVSAAALAFGLVVTVSPIVAAVGAVAVVGDAVAVFGDAAAVAASVNAADDASDADASVISASCHSAATHAPGTGHAARAGRSAHRSSGTRAGIGA